MEIEIYRKSSFILTIDIALNPRIRNILWKYRDSCNLYFKISSSKFIWHTLCNYWEQSNLNKVILGARRKLFSFPTTHQILRECLVCASSVFSTVDVVKGKNYFKQNHHIHTNKITAMINVTKRRISVLGKYILMAPDLVREIRKIILLSTLFRNCWPVSH